jgi:methylenetetrahydrofolate--tRNA-(uracil-5-)-methyltransferase
LIPGLENARFLRYGQIHRNTYIQAPLLLDECLRLNPRAAASENAVPQKNAVIPSDRTLSTAKGKGVEEPASSFRPDHPILFAGQLSGVEGYTESIATGLLAGLYAAALVRGEEPIPAPRASALGSLVHYITHADPKDFQPANITFDLLEPLEEELRKRIRDKKERHRLVCERSLAAFDAWWNTIPHPEAELRA